MRIKKVSVKGLFGVFDHEIPINLDSRITIIHGANGVGKTILLRMINGLFSRNFSVFRKIPFDTFHIVFDNGETLLALKTRTPPEQPSLFEVEEDTKQTDVKFQMYNNNGERIEDGEYIPRFSIRQMHELTPVIDSLIPELSRIGARRWRRRSDEEILTLEDIWHIYSDSLPDTIDSESIKNMPPWFRILISQVQIRFIQANRLYRYNDLLRSRYDRYSDVPLPVSMVTQYSAEIASLIQKKLSEYAELSQSLDRSFPMRLMKRDNSIKIDSVELQKRLEELEGERDHLIRLGLLDRDQNAPEMPTVHDDESLSSVLSIYVQDMEQKLAIFNDISNRLEIFEGIINDRFQFKHFTLDKNQGFVFTSPYGIDISVENLSSGEQHELVLLYQLLFQVQPDSLILIDEPELSLHVAWQRRFLDDLQQIAGLGQFDVLIATHSPQIIGDKQNWMVALESPDSEFNALQHA